MIAVVIADIVGSREIPDRAAGQRVLEAALARADAMLPGTVALVHPLRAVVGDELQGTFGDLRSALAATLLQRLVLPAGIDLRFGIGLGEIEQVPSVVGQLSEGPAWWAARAAIEYVEALARRDVPSARTWVRSAPEEAAAADLVRIANAGLATRDRLIGQWSDRVRRLVAGRIGGATQLELAETEGVSQSAVSQSLSTSGAAAVVAAYEELVASPGG